MSQCSDNNKSFEESKKLWKALIDRICSDDEFAYYFFHERCRPLFSMILWKMFDNSADYDELINELFLALKKPDRNGEMWHALKTYDFRTSPFDWLKTVAIRHFNTSSNEIFLIPDSVIQSGIVESMFSELRKAIYRKYMCFKYLDQLEDDTIASKLNIECAQLMPLSRKAIRQLKSIVAHHYPEYYSLMFQKTNVIEVEIDENVDSVSTGYEESKQDSRIDVFQYLDSMPNEYYRKVIQALFIEDKSPEVLAKEMETPVSNIYNIKSRGLDQLRDVALFSNEIRNLEKYIKLVSDDRNRFILTSIFLKKMDYEAICSELRITEIQFKKLKKDAIKKLKTIIFKKDHDDK